MEVQVEAAIAGTLAWLGRLDVVVNCAGLMEFKPLAERTTEDWQQTLNVDLLERFTLCKQAFQQMKPSGTIVNVSSIHTYKTSPTWCPTRSRPLWAR